VVWGYDQWGESGDGTGVASGCLCVDTPTAVPGLSGVTAISAGAYLGSALMWDGTVKDWGYNNNGAVGNGTENTTTTCDCVGPVTVSGISGASETISGGYHGLARVANGSLQAWGYNTEGELGTGANTASGCDCIPTPVAVSDLPSDPQAVAAGEYHTVVLFSDGTVGAWGYNSYGEIGDGATNTTGCDCVNPSVPVAGLSGVSGVYTGDYSSYALVGPSQSLTVSFAGAGDGKVGGDGILCASRCARTYPQGQVESLLASSAGFAGWSGGCTGTAICRVNLSTDKTVTATFGAAKGTRITRSRFKENTARFSFKAPGAITRYKCKLVRPRPARGKTPKARYATCKSAKTYTRLKVGRYVFRVRAVDRIGPDAKPASRSFTIKAAKREKD
jgi:hypothetical protein